MKPMPLVAVAMVMLCITLQIAETTTELQPRVHGNDLAIPDEYVIEKITEYLKDSPANLQTMQTLITNQHGGQQTIQILNLVINGEKNFRQIMEEADFLDRIWFKYLKPSLGVVIGGVAGATIGSIVLPGYGTAIGGVAGGVAGAILTSKDLSNWMNENFFNLSKKEALQNAYNFLQLENGASNNQIDSNFERLALEHHPDKVGNYDDLLKLSLSKGYIQMSKGEWF